MAVALLGRLLCVAVLVSSSSAQEIPRNVALNKSASQSSTFDGRDGSLTYRASADLAVDGAPTKRYLDGTCAVTDWQRDGSCRKGLWWQVNLGELYDILNVTIFQRGDAANNFGPLVVRVGDHVERPENRKTYNDNPIVRVILSPPVTASIVNISIDGCGILQLCEVEVFAVRPSPRNVALGKGATQSSTFSGNDGSLRYTGSADLAVDGAPTKSYRDMTCAVSDWSNGGCINNPWWQVNLGGLYDVVNVTIYLRGEGEEAAKNFGPLVVRVGDHVERPENRTQYNDRPIVRVILSPPVTASTVNISITGCAILILCEVEVFAVRYANECASNPCQHGGSCTDGLLNYTCHCVPGYTGVNCETEVDECVSKPCQHGGNCTDGFLNYTCDCAPGYTGFNCETDVDECVSNPCQHGGSCTNAVPGYTCDCVPGYTGVNCEIDVNECENNPCLNGGNCTDGVAAYTCVCVPGYAGVTCEAAAGSTGPASASIIGGVIGAAVLVLIVAVILVVVWMRRRQHPKAQSSFLESSGSRKMSQRNNRTRREEEGQAEEEEMEEPHAGVNDGFYYNGPLLLPPTCMSPAQLQKVVAACQANTDHLKAQYERLPQGLQHPSEVGMNEHNKGKNRYKNICAYDHSRVVLSTLPGDPHSDYINACYVDGYKMPNAFIASQGPTIVNERDFIRMIWEKDIETIAMVTNPTEMGKVKCVQYWSDTEEVKFGKFKVKVNSIKEKRDITIRRFTIKPSDGAAKQVTHFLYKAWPDKDVPDSTWSLIDFRDKIMTSHKGRSSPILIHCSAGIGRTGTLIALDMALRQLEEEGVVDLFNIVLQIRQHRVGLVQTQSQYVFLHEAALVGLCCADRVVPLESLNSDPVARDEARAEVEFKALERGSTAFSAEDLSLATTEEALYANRDPDILPPNDNIVWLRNELEGFTNYINAVFVPSYTEEKRYIVTQTPLPFTVVNFWRAVLEYNVKVIVTLDQIKPDPKARVGEFVPTGKTPVILGPLTLTSIRTEGKQTYTAHCIEVTMGKEKPRRVQQFVVDLWPDSACVPSDPRQMVSLAHAVLDCTPPQQGVILLHCRDGARRSGLVCGLLALLERCDSDREVAVPYVVGVLKSIRPQAVPTQEQYAFLYSAMLSHADNSMVYENVPRPKQNSGDADHIDNIYSN